MRVFLSDLEYHRDNVFEITYISKKALHWPLHNHPEEFMIFLVFDGILHLRYADGAYPMHAGDFLAIPPYCTHSAFSEELVSVLCLGVNKEAVEQDGAKVLNLIDDIVEKLQRQGLVETKHIVSLSKAASQILYLFRQQDDACSEFVAEAREHLEKWPEKSISLDAMADLVNVCRGHLLRTFKKEVGLTPHQFQIQNRVRKAVRLLIDTENTIESIGRECGFFDKSHFKRHFRRLLGMTPHEYRTAYRGAQNLFAV